MRNYNKFHETFRFFQEPCHADSTSQITEQDLLPFAIILPLIKTNPLFGNPTLSIFEAESI